MRFVRLFTHVFSCNIRFKYWFGGLLHVVRFVTFDHREYLSSFLLFTSLLYQQILSPISSTFNENVNNGNYTVLALWGSGLFCVVVYAIQTVLFSILTWRYTARIDKKCPLYFHTFVISNILISDCSKINVIVTAINMHLEDNVFPFLGNR